MDCHLVLSGKEPPVRQGNLLYYTILKANLHFVPDNEDLEGFASNLAEELKKKGQKPVSYTHLDVYKRQAVSDGH